MGNNIHNSKDTELIKDLSVLIGTRIKIKHIEGAPSATGRVGVVTHVDDQGILHGTWGTIGVIYFEDDIELMF